MDSSLLKGVAIGGYNPLISKLDMFLIPNFRCVLKCDFCTTRSVFFTKCDIFTLQT